MKALEDQVFESKLHIFKDKNGKRVHPGDVLIYASTDPTYFVPEGANAIYEGSPLKLYFQLQKDDDFSEVLVKIPDRTKEKATQDAIGKMEKL